MGTTSCFTAHCYTCEVAEKCVIQPKTTQVIALWTTNHTYTVIPYCAQLWIATKCHKALLEILCQMTPGIRMFELAAPQIHIAEDDPRRLIRDGVGLVQLYRVLEMWNLQTRRIRPELYVSIMGEHQSAVIYWLASHPSRFMSSRSIFSFMSAATNLSRMKAMLRFCRRIWDSTMANIQLPFQLRLQEIECLTA